MTKTLVVADARQWRAWLSTHHRREKEVWLIFFKKHTGRASIPSGEAICEALCFGWIDSLIQRVDDDSYALRFTPRADGKKWSALNKARVARLIKEGRMTAAGLAVAGDLKAKPTAAPPPKDLPTPPELIAALKKNAAAWKNFQALAPSYRWRYACYITFAKKDETRRARIADAVRRLARNDKLSIDRGSRGGRGAKLNDPRPAVPPGAHGDAHSAAAGASRSRPQSTISTRRRPRPAAAGPRAGSRSG